MALSSDAKHHLLRAVRDNAVRDELVTAIDANTVTSGKAETYMTTGTLAAAGSTQANSPAITTQTVVVTTDSAAKGCKLPAASSISHVNVINATAATAFKVWPNTGAKIDAGSADAAYDQGAGKRVTFYSNGTDWFTQVGA